MRRPSLLLLAVGLCACHAGADFPIPMKEEGDRAALAVVLTGDGPVFGVFDLEKEAPGPFVAPGGAPLAWLVFKETFAELHFDLVNAAQPTGETRLIPPFERGLATELGGEPLAPFPRESRPAWLDELRIPAPELEDCAARGGCLQPWRGELSCLVCRVVVPRESRNPALALLAPVDCIQYGLDPFFLDQAGFGPSLCTSPKRAACPDGEGARFGDDVCAHVGPSCPAGDFAGDLPVGARYVLAGAPAGGDGSLAQPFDTLARAIDAVATGSVLALSKGGHLGATRIDKDLALRGACDETRLLGAPGSPTLVAAAGVVTLERLRVETHGAEPALAIEGGAVELMDVILTSSSATAGSVASVGAGARLAATNTLIDGGRSTRGLSIRGEVELDDVTVVRVAEVGLELDGPRAELDAERLILVRVEGDPLATGLRSRGGAEASLRATLFEGSGPIGIDAEGGRLALDGIVLRGGPRGLEGVGVRASAGAQLEAYGVTLIDRQYGGFDASGEATRARIRATGVVSALGANRPFESVGYGVRVTDGASVSLGRAFIQNRGGAGVSVSGAFASLTDVRIREAHGLRNHSSGGDCIAAEDGARVELLRVTASSCDRWGLFAGPGTEVAGRDVQISTSNLGVFAKAESRVTVDAVELRGNFAGVCVEDRAFVSLSNVELADTRPFETLDPAPCGAVLAEGGVGLVLAPEGRLELSELWITVSLGRERIGTGLILGRLPDRFEHGLVEQQRLGARVGKAEQESLVRGIVFRDNDIAFEDD